MEAIKAENVSDASLTESIINPAEDSITNDMKVG